MLIQENILLSTYSTFKIGGPAKYFVKVSTSADILSAIAWAREKKIAYRIVAGGSNIVFPDEGIDGLIIHVSGNEVTLKENTLTAQAGVLLAKVIETAIEEGKSGLEQLSGIPGTIGGAVVGNAGAYGRNIGEVVERIEIFNGEVSRWIQKDECHFSYRHSIFKENPYLVLQVVLTLSAGKKEDLKKLSQEIIKIREKKYKPGLACPGSFFKNIITSNISPTVLKRIDTSKIIAGKIPAGYLLQEIGAPGMRKGGIAVADFHGNLLFNIGHGTAKEVKELAQELKERVKARFGILLEEEVRYF
jgi:UDP-N-acetylmuramate dehydrogenase